MKTLMQVNRVNRRSLLKGAGAAGLAMPFINHIVKPAHAQERVVRMANYGGSYAEAMRKVWFDPFEKETGIKVVDGPGSSLALAKLQVMNSAGAEWDIIDLPTDAYALAVREDLLAPIEGRVDTSKILPEYVGTHSWAYVTFVYVVGHNTDMIKAEDAPQVWADLWDIERYSGKRAFNTVKTSAISLEAALLADGVPASEIYPMDLDRAFASLDKLGKENIVWGTSLQDPVQQIGSGAAPTGGIYTGRAVMASRDGAKIGLSAKQSLIGTDSLCVMKNSNHKEEAFALLDFIATRGDLAAQFCLETSYGIPHEDVDGLLPEDATEIRRFLPTNPELRSSALISDTEYYADNMEEIAQRFQEWQLF